MVEEFRRNFFEWVDGTNSVYSTLLGAERELGREDIAHVYDFLVYVTDPDSPRCGQIGQLVGDGRAYNVHVEFVDGQRVIFDEPQRDGNGQWIGKLKRIPKTYLTDRDKKMLEEFQPGLGMFFEGKWNMGQEKEEVDGSRT
jgi:hypothetical protein